MLPGQTDLCLWLRGKEEQMQEKKEDAVVELFEVMEFSAFLFFFFLFHVFSLSAS